MMENVQMKGTTGDKQTDTVIRDVYSHLNKIIESLGKSQVGTPAGSSGTEGQVVVVRNGANSYLVAIRAGDGWLVSDTTTFTFKTKLD